MAAAIRERRILSLTCDRAVQPQLFAPLALYVSATNQLMVDGYEVNGRRVRWREVELHAVRDVGQTEHTYTFSENATPIYKTYPRGATVIASATTVHA
jgi:hypothetical protein